MYILSEMLNREREAEILRASGVQGRTRGSLRIKLDARRARRNNPAG
jgi:hypothetical protein